MRQSRSGGWARQRPSPEPTPPAGPTPAPDAEHIRQAIEDLVRQAADRTDADLDMGILQDEQALLGLCRQMITATAAATEAAAWLTPELQQEAAERLQARLTGLDFLDALIRSEMYTDIKINSDGQVWTRRKGGIHFEPQPDLHPDPNQVARMATALLAPVLKSCTEATPSENAKIPRGGRYGGARVKVLHPVICSGNGHHIDIRLYEPEPVPPERIVAWGMCPEPVLEFLLHAVADERRVVVSGGTGSGKTTLLSALLHALPATAAVVKVEDPEEIWLEHPNVETLERRPSPPGSPMPAYEIKDAVDDAMRMSPSHLIVGEVRDGEAALALFRALMSDHSGGTTFHASSAHDALHRMGLIMMADRNVAMHAGRQLVLSAIDLIVQIGIRDGVRRVLAIHELRHPLDKKQGDGDMTLLWSLGDDPERIPAMRRQAQGMAGA